jgi:hypothetical protein
LYHDSNSSLRLRDANTNGDFLMYHSGNLTNLNQLTNGPGYAVSASPTFSGNVKRSVANNITAVGSTQATAAVLTNTDIAVVQFGPGAGVALPASAVGAEVVIINNSGGAINVYPPSGATIDWLAANAAYSLGDKSKLTFVCTSASQWFSLTAVFA